MYSKKLQIMIAMVALSLTLGCHASFMSLMQQNPLPSMQNAALAAAVVCPTGIMMRYASLMNNPSADDYYKAHFTDALRAYGVVNPEKVSLKNSHCGHLLGVCTPFGAALDQEKLAPKSHAYKLYTCWHEAAHYALKHPHKDLGLMFIPGAALGCLALAFSGKSTYTKKILGSCGALLCSLPLIKKAWSVYLPWGEKSHEKEADALAMEHLIRTGRECIITLIEKEYQDNFNGWDDVTRLAPESRTVYMTTHNYTEISLMLARNAAEKELIRWQLLRAQVHAKLAQKN